MKNRTASNGVVIKSLGKASGNIDPVKLRAVIRRLQADRPVAADEKVRPIRIQDTATGSGKIQLVFGAPRSGKKAKAKPASRARAQSVG